MRRICQQACGIALAAAIAALSGCESKPAQPKPGGGKQPPASTAGEKPVPDKAVKSPKGKPTEKTSLEDAIAKVDKPAEATIPEVKLTEAMKAECLVKVGDAMPAGELQDLDGKAATLSSLLGKQATVVFFWDRGKTPTDKVIAATALEDIERDVVAPFADKGLAVVGVNVGDAPEDIRKMMADAGAKFPTLSDAKGEYFAKLAKDAKPPRVYVLNASGAVVWFDVEFSRSTRRDLAQAVAAVLKQQ